MQSDPQIQALAELLTIDPRQRGVAGLRPWGAKSAAEALAQSATRLVADCQRIAIVTGFCIPAARPPAAETDGPPGALALADALERLGKSIVLVTDSLAAPLLAEGCSHRQLRAELLIPDLLDPAWRMEPLSTWDALIAIERVGPSHDGRSVFIGARDRDHVATLFDSEVPPEHRDRRHNMRGDVIDADSPPLDALFTHIKSVHPRAFTLGIGDGGNEIGMGCFPWEQLRAAIQRGPGARIACRIATDEVITCGVSNWGGYALAAALGTIETSLDLCGLLDVDREQALLDRLVAVGAVDGVTLEHTPTVDGVPTQVYFNLMRRIGDLGARGR